MTPTNLNPEYAIHGRGSNPRWIALSLSVLCVVMQHEQQEDINRWPLHLLEKACGCSHPFQLVAVVL